ncbi:MAG: hypothetical protein U9R19_17205 [Bacteroidota bacterium]|nr:hypothetical protein [Bacteroidota bacterium]
MAFTTTIRDWWQKVNGADKYEDKLAGIGAYNAFKADTINLIPNIGEIIAGRVNPNQALKFPVIKKNEQAVGTVRTIGISGTEGVSALQAITYGTITYDILLSPSSFAGNEIGYEKALMRELANADIAMARKADILAVAALDANKNLVDNTSGYPLSFAAGLYTASNAQKDKILNVAPQILTANNFEDEGLNIIGSIETKSEVSELMQFGVYNNQNKALVLNDKNFYFSNRLVRGTGNQMTMFAAPKGTLAVIPFIESDAQMGIDLGGKKYYKVFMPKLGLSVGVYEIKDAVDRSGIDGAGFEHAATYKWQLAVDLAFVTPYNSDTAVVTAPIHKIECTIA